MQRGPDRTRIAAVAFGAAMVVASLVPGSGVSTPGFALLGIVGLDKVAHAGGFLVLTVLSLASLDHRWGIIAVVVGLGALGGGIEVAQTTIPGRTFERADFLADLVGVVAGLAVHRWLEPARGWILGTKPL
ncbi:VanZ like family protein [Halanaeroarchaeum sp. HSR-CO]|uniref:VanZ family protein n=1 Tax=Halanaeroarchaeum sp. HSR-CO TaxID=2866382 RepID=UPI00217E749A|nr:VanZ family protein [Halanaeroarchaeum sp. HSR-CO]UWG48853.1 VanZ like family protein [Halanaeroarchaeum sp. HSR-CO]